MGVALTMNVPGITARVVSSTQPPAGIGHDVHPILRSMTSAAVALVKDMANEEAIFCESACVDVIKKITGGLYEVEEEAVSVFVLVVVEPYCRPWIQGLVKKSAVVHQGDVPRA